MVDATPSGEIPAAFDLGYAQRFSGLGTRQELDMIAGLVTMLLHFVSLDSSPRLWAEHRVYVLEPLHVVAVSTVVQSLKANLSKGISHLFAYYA